MQLEPPASPYAVDAVGAALLRSLSGDASLQWNGQNLYQGTQPIDLLAPHQLHQPQWTGSWLEQRALLDGAALRLRFSDAALHAAHAPTEPVERLVYELLEQLRTESLVPADWPGVRHNLALHFQRWCQHFVDSGLTESSLGILLFTLALTSWSRMGGEEVPPAMADRAEATRAYMSSTVGHCWVALRQHRHCQSAFIPHALELCRWMGQAVHSAEAAAGAAPAPSRNGFVLKLHFSTPDKLTPPNHSAGSAAVSAAIAHGAQAGRGYRVFSKAYDREVAAAALVRPAQLAELRAHMDAELEQAAYHMGRLSRYLRKNLALPDGDGWQFGMESGYVDGSRLALLVGNPQATSVFKDVRQSRVVQCAVTLLLDCSGSMKTHAERTSILVDVLGRALEMAGVVVEVLGFSTNAWNGGRVRRDWQAAGQPQCPGRLNEVLHLVFKSAALPWRRGRRGIAALRRPDLFREGVDAEALEWACQRLRNIPAKRRILLVVSDGCPMDTATAECNGEDYLANHLQHMVPLLQRREGVEICAVGLAGKLGHFYPHHRVLDLKNGVGDAVFMQIAALLCAPRRRYSQGG